ncbi:SART-1-domain-containing protein [Coniophora puteana RWD-64-598 SS2]|uniref:SART-1-domain-containing protein n=1 Tax=Coniophora puteana (strain RWD-64-598) TaxID=741705 RepID=A0A5M3MX51_CONPW|nr:SART-1-domain-containing protein [Coniophora puteana RWD-64-598 SS2]EIW83719.1 SART-1-domain-containing protein [Coniophora puteana RWD-64-598 SS2]
MSMEESISLEETNKIRISLGLKPLSEDAAPADDQDKQAEDNYAKRREAAAKESQTKKIVDRIAKVRNKRELNASLTGVTLGDPEGDTDDALKWIKKAKKKEKELAKKRQQELENMDKMFQEEYGEKDLAGLKVNHGLDDLDEGAEHILTLKDSRILDNEEDELQNVELAEAERTRKNNELKIKRRDYTGYDDEEFTEGKAGMKRSVLAKYDEELEGSMESGFRLGSSAAAVKKEIPKAEQESTAVNRALLSIDYDKNLEMSDYLKEGDVGFKKPKTKKKRSSRRAPVDSELGAADGDENGMDVDEKPVALRPRDLDANFVDDDDLQAALARSRRAKIHKPRKLAPEEIARRVLEERNRDQSANVEDVPVKVEDPDGVGEGEEGVAGGGLTFDDTSEFVRSISYNPVAVKVEPVEPASVPPPKAATPVAKRESGSPTRGDASMAEGDQAIDEIEAGEVVKEEGEEMDDEQMLSAIEAMIKQTEEETAAAKEGEVAENGEGDVGTSSEQTFGSGMASTLNILRQQGILSTPAADQTERERVQRQRDVWLADYRFWQAQRELERLQARGGNKDQAQREYENRMREQQEARQQLDLFKNYKPDVNIVYYDEFGRTLTPKEAWKALSHKFHGKGSGKMKTEKRLKKIAEEKKQEAMASGDTPLSMNKAFQMRQEKTGQAHFVLSVGNRGAVPQAAEFLEPQPLSKGKTEKTKSKKKGADKASNAQGANGSTGGFMTVPAPLTVHSTTASDSPGSGFASIVSEAGTGANSPAPAGPKKSGFSRISSAVGSGFTPSPTGTPGGTPGGTPVPTDRTKVAFGFGMKRKAEDELAGGGSKRR